MLVPCTPATIHNYERRGPRKGQAAILVGIARALGLPEREFLSSGPLRAGR